MPLAIATVVAGTALNYASMRWRVFTNNVLSAVKVGALAAFAFAGPFTGAGSAANLRPLVDGIAGVATFGAFALALSPILFSYLGWNASVYVASEIRDPARNVPRSLFVGLALCAGVYLLMNALYLYALPIPALRETANAGEAAAHVLFGDLGGKLVAGFVLLSILGTLNATIILAAADRVRDGARRPLRARRRSACTPRGTRPRSRSSRRRSSRRPAGGAAKLPVRPRLHDVRDRPRDDRGRSRAALAAREAAGRPRPYRAWGTPFIPALYVTANLAIAVGLAVGSPVSVGVSAIVIASALPFYAVLRWVRQEERG